MKKNRKNPSWFTENDILKESMPDTKIRRILVPRKIVWCQGNVENASCLYQKKEMQISLKEEEVCTMNTRNGGKASILLDYGIEIHGGIRILALAESGRKCVRVRIRLGESVSEAMSELGGERNATNDHAVRDLTMDIPTMSMTPVGESGFRFVRIDLEEADAILQLKSVCAVMIYRDIPYRGKFFCSDPLLNRIWEVGAYTVHLNMQDYIWDGIKRDRLVWVGDMHPETAVIRTVFGEDDAVEKSLDFIRKKTPLPGWMNDMASYSMWYILIVADWFLYTGKKAFLEKQKTYLDGLMEQLSAKIDKEGKDTVEQGRFLDWPSVGREKVVDAGVQALHIMAAERLKMIYAALGDQVRIKRCEEDLGRLRRYETDYEDSKQAAALAVLAGQKDAGEVNSSLLKKGGAKGMSTFMGYYILTARAMADDYSGCLQTIREYWGGMLELGATTFWEDFNVEWMDHASRIDELPEEGKIDVHASYGGYCYRGYRHSLCHGWAGGVTPWLSEQVLGVQILEPGCRKVRISPHLGDLSWAEGSYPTPYGEIFIRHWRRENAEVESEVHVPDGVLLCE